MGLNIKLECFLDCMHACPGWMIAYVSNESCNCESAAVLLTSSYVGVQVIMHKIVVPSYFTMTNGMANCLPHDNVQVHDTGEAEDRIESPIPLLK